MTLPNYGRFHSKLSIFSSVILWNIAYCIDMYNKTKAETGINEPLTHYDADSSRKGAVKFVLTGPSRRLPTTPMAKLSR